jgi:hypothetical protein
MYSGIRQAYSVSVFGKRIWRAHSVSVFGNLVSGLSMALGLLGYRSSYPAVLGMVCNNYPLSKVDCPQSTLFRIEPVLIKKPGGIYVHPSQEKEWLAQL